MNWQLVVHEDPEMASVVADQLRTVLKALNAGAVAAGATPIRCAPIEAHNIERATAYLDEQDAERCSVVIVGSATPQSAQASAGLTGRSPTRQFVKALKKLHPDLPVVVLATTPDESLMSFIEAFDRIAVVAIDSGFARGLADRVAAFHAGTAAAAPADAVAPPRVEPHVEFHLHLGNERQATWHVKRLGDDPFEDAGPLTIDSEKLERVLFDSGEMERTVPQAGADPARWLQRLKYLSNDLRVLLFEGDMPNVGCWDTFLKNRERVGGLEHARIRVTVDDRTHPMLVEALRDLTGADHEYWALRAPLFRRYDRSAARRPLYKDPDRRHSPIHFLLIEADGRRGNLPEYGGAVCEELPGCAVEARGIVAALTRAGLQAIAAGQPVASPLGGFEHLRLEDCDGDLREVVAAKLKERPWHVVHFCGHVVGATVDDAGLVLAAERGGVLSVAALTAQLHDAQLMFLSSCRSGAARVVMQAVEQHIPAVLGFQWVIDDRGAARFALAFYEALFGAGGAGHKYLEYAFMQARRAVYETAPREPTWVAPVLVMQMD